MPNVPVSKVELEPATEEALLTDPSQLKSLPVKETELADFLVRAGHASHSDAPAELTRLAASRVGRDQVG
jgi:hypothetical protein